MNGFADPDASAADVYQERSPDPRDRAHGRFCLVCGKKLGDDDRKVHAGNCARIRKVSLRRMSRARRRQR